MPSKKSLRKQIRNTAYNKPVISKTKTSIKSAKIAIKENPSSEPTMQKIGIAIKSLDKAVQKGVIHRNKAARKKSRILGYLKKENSN